MQQTPRTDRPFAFDRSIAAVLGVAVLYRMIFLVQIRSSAFFQVPLIDSWEYHLDALRILTHGQPHHIAFWHPPAYPYLLAGIYGLTGSTAMLWPALANMLFGVLCVYLTFIIARIVSGPRSAPIAAILALMQPVLMTFEVQRLSVSLECLLNLLWILLMLLAFRAPDRRLVVFATGIVLGLSIVTRPTVLLLVPVAIVVLASHRRHIMPFIIGVLLIVSPVTIRNYLVSDEIVLVSSNGGINFFVGNNPDFRKTTALRPGSEWSMLIQRHPDQDGEMASAEWYREGFRFIAANPGQAVRNNLWKLFQTIHASEIIRNIDFKEFRNNATIMRFPGVDFGWLIALAVPGLCIMTPGSSRRVIALYLVMMMVSIVIFFAATRYRLPMVHLLAVCASVTILRGTDAIRSRRFRREDWILAGSAAALLTLTHLPVQTGLPTDIQRRDTLMNLADVEERSGDLSAAAGYLEQVIATDASFPDAYQRLGVYALRRSDLQSARGYFQKSRERCPGSPLPVFNLGIVALRLERYEEALGLFGEAARLDPVNPEYALYSGQAAKLAGDQELMLKEIRRAIEGYRKKIRQYPFDAANHRSLGQASQMIGDRSAAIGAYRTTIEMDPSDTTTLRELVENLVQIQDFKSALPLARRLTAIDGADAEAFDLLGNVLIALRQYSGAISAYRTACLKAPRSGAYQNRLAVAYFAVGDHDSARRHARSAMDLGFTIDPGFRQVLGLTSPNGE